MGFYYKSVFYHERISPYVGTILRIIRQVNSFGTIYRTKIKRYIFVGLVRLQNILWRIAHFSFTHHCSTSTRFGISGRLAH